MDEQARQIHIQSVKSVFHKVLWLVAGAAVGICLPLLFHCPRSEDVKEESGLVQRDSTERKDTLGYGPEELAPERVQPKDTEYVYITLPPEVIEKIVRDTVYVPKNIALPREHYYLEKGYTRIWYSGIEPRIDSLVNTRVTTVITETYRKADRHTLSVYGETGYSEGLSVLAGARYLFHPNRWLGVGAEVERDFLMHQTNVKAVAEITISWN